MLLSVFGALLLLGATLAGPSAAAQEIQIREVDTSQFPTVGLTLSLQEAAELSAEDVQVTENGTPVEGPLTLQPLEETGGSIDVVLVVDTSGSMEGEPLASAVAAATLFVQGLPEQVRIGVVAFDQAPRVLQRPTRDHSAAFEAVTTLSARGETALYDAVIRAAEVFGGEGQRNLVLLSDGGDTVSRSGLDSAVRAAQRAEATIFAVGLRTPETDVQALRRLAEATEGRYAPAATADLTAVYQGLATELANQYVVRYRSASPAGSEVSVGVSALGAADSALVLTPEAEAPPEPPREPAPVPSADPLLAGPVGMAVALGLTFLALFSVLMMLLGAGLRQRRDQVLARRVAAGGRPKEGGAAEGSTPGSRVWLPEGLVATAQRAADASGVGKGLDARLERAGLPFRPGEFVLTMLLTTLVGALVGAALLRAPLFVLLSAVAGGVLPVLFLSIKIDRRRAAFEAQLPDVLMLLASSLRAGHSFLQALDMVAKEIAEPARQEFARVVAEIRLGRHVDEALIAVAERIGTEDLKWAVMAVNVQREVGGNLAEVLDTVAHTVQERETIRRQIKTLSAEGRLSAWILGTLPFVFALYLIVVNPGYLGELFSTEVGVYMVVGAGALLVAGVLWMRKMVKIDV
jgi:tight adherence protein B